MAEVAALGLRVDGADGVERATGALDDLTRASDSAEKSTDKLAKKSGEGKRSLDGLASSGNKASSVMAQLGAAALKVGAMVGIGLSINALKNYADTWSDMQSRVGASIGDMSKAASTMQRVVDIANASYSPLQQTVNVFSRNVATFNDIGRSASQAADFTEALNHALVTTATRGQDADVVVNSLSRALATGGINAQDFDTVVARSPRVLKAMADELGVTTSAMRQMTIDGKVTTDVIANGLINSLDQLRSEAAKMPATIADSFVRVQNNVTELVGNVDKATGASSALAETVLGFADGIRSASGNIVSFSTMLVPALSLAASAVLAIAKQADIAIVALSGFFAPALIGGVALLTKALAFGLVGAIKAVTVAIMANPIGLLVATLGVAVYAWYEYGKTARDNADAGSLQVADMKGSVEELVAEYQKLNTLQKESVLNVKTEDLANSTKDVQKALYDLSFAFQATREQGIANMAQFAADFSIQINSIATNTSLSSDQMANALSGVINSFIESGKAAGENKQELIDIATRLVEAAAKSNNLKVQIDALKQSLTGVKQAAASTNLEPKGIEKWDEYLKKLTDARDMVGMNARQLGEFKAAQAGANSVQKQMAGIITAQTDEYRKLEQAIQSKDTKAAEAAKANIRNLDIEAQRVALLAKQMAAVAAAAAAFARGDASGNMAAGVFMAMSQGFANQSRNLKPSPGTEAQIKNIYGNTTPGKGSKGAGGGGGSQSELQTYIKNLKEQQATFGMSEVAAERYRIETMKGTEADRARALALYDQIQALKRAQDSSRMYLAFQREMQVFQEKANLQAAAVGMGDRQREEAQRDLEIRQEYAQKRLELEQAQQVKSTALEQEQYQERLRLLQETENQKLAIVQNANQARLAAESDWTNGAARALQNYLDKAANVAAQTESLFTNALGTMTSSFGQAFESMVFDSESLGESIRNVAQSIVRSIVNALGQMAAQWLAYQAVQLATGRTTQASAAATLTANATATSLQAGLAAFASTAAIPIVGPFLAPAAMAAALAVTTPMAAAVGTAALAGMAHDGIDSVPQTGTWLLQKGERVTTASTSAKLDSVLERIDARQRGARSAAAPMASNQGTNNQRPIINLIEDKSRAGTVESTRNEDGSEQTNLFVADIFGGGESAQALERVYGLTRVGQ